LPPPPPPALSSLPLPPPPPPAFDEFFLLPMAAPRGGLPLPLPPPPPPFSSVPGGNLPPPMHPPSFAGDLPGSKDSVKWWEMVGGSWVQRETPAKRVPTRAPIFDSVQRETSPASSRSPTRVRPTRSELRPKTGPIRPTSTPGMKELREATAVAAAAAAAAAAGPRIRPTQGPRPRANPVFLHVLGAEEHYQAQERAQEALEEHYQAQERAELGLEESNPQGGEEEWNEEEAQQQQQEQQQEQEHASMEEDWDWDAHMGPEEEEAEPEEEDLMATLVREAEDIPPRR
jgi:hypothetical protein